MPGERFLIFSTMNATDHWKALRGGDKRSLEWLYRTYAAQLLRYGYAFSQDAALIEDCLQELFIMLWEKRENLGDTSSPKNYLFASFRRSIWKKVRKNAGKQEKESESQGLFEAELNIEEQTIMDEEEAAMAKKLKQAMEELTGRQKELLYLKYEEGLSYEEICEMMDLKYQSARNLLTSAVKKLRELIGILFFLIFLVVIEYSGKGLGLYK